MSEKLLRILLSELTLVRVRCLNQACLRVCELEIGKLGSTYAQNVCPLCHTPFQAVPPHGHLRDQLSKLSEAIEGLKAAKDQIEVSFVLPDKD